MTRNPWYIISWRVLAIGPAFALIYGGRLLMTLGGLLFKGPEGARRMWNETDI